jgi:hypothetical protein
MREETLDGIKTLSSMLYALGELIRRDTEQAVATNDHIEIIRHYAHMREAASIIKEARTAISDMEEKMSRETVPETMRAHGVKTITVIGVGRVTISHRFSCSMLDKESGITWLKDTGNGGIVQETVNSSTLSAFAKDLIQNHGKELPNNLFKTSINPFTSITKV